MNPAELLASIPDNAPPGDLERLLRPALEAIASTGSIEQDAYVQMIARRFQVGRRTVRELVERASPRRNAQAHPQARPRIVVNNRQLRDIVSDAWCAIQATNRRPKIFLRSGALVRIARGASAARIEMLDETAIIGALTRMADWVRATENADLAAFPPRDVARDLLAYPAPSMPRLEAVLATPVFGASGRLLESPGYHAEDAAWIESPPNFRLPDVSLVPSDTDVATARSLLLDDLLADFPFVDASDRAHMVALLLLPFVQRLVAGPTPLHVIEAPTAGSGKSLLANLVAVLTTGAPANARALPTGDDEIRKMITSELVTGRSFFVIDNVDNRRPLDSASLASVLTATSWTDRVLGHTRMVTVPNRAVWVLTANNPRISMEIARRCVRIRIDPRMDRPWLRGGFRHAALLAWVHEHRAKLVHAVLTLVQHWIANERPRSEARLGSFERWSETIGGILDAAAVPGFLGNLQALYETADAEGAMWRELVETWWSTHENKAVRVAELVKLCASNDLLGPVLGDGSEKAQQIRLGRALQNERDRMFGRYRIEVVKDAHTKRPTYRLVRVDAAQ